MRVEEDIDRLFFSCEFARSWHKLLIHWDVTQSLLPRIFRARAQQNLPFFMEDVLIAAWELWKLQNDKVFEGRRPSHSLWFCNFKKQVPFMGYLF